MVHLDPDQEPDDEDMEFHVMRQRSDDSISSEEDEERFHLQDDVDDMDDDDSIY